MIAKILSAMIVQAGSTEGPELLYWMITFPPPILKAEWMAVSDWIYIFHLLNSCFCSCCLRLTVHVLIKPTTSFLVKPKQSFILLSGTASGIKAIYIHTDSVWVQTFRRFSILKGVAFFPVLRVPVCLKVWRHQPPSAPSASVPAQECSQYWSPWAFSAQPLPLLKVGRWRRQGSWGSLHFLSFTSLQEMV